MAILVGSPAGTHCDAFRSVPSSLPTQAEPTLSVSRRGEDTHLRVRWGVYSEPPSCAKIKCCLMSSCVTVGLADCTARTKSLYVLRNRQPAGVGVSTDDVPCVCDFPN